MWNGRSDNVVAVGCFVAILDGLWLSLPPFMPLLRPPHRVLVLSEERYNFLVVTHHIIVFGEVRDKGGGGLLFWVGMSLRVK